MSEKKVVRVVKRAEPSSRKPGSARVARETARKTATNMVTNVASWVTEFQERQRAETAKAIDNLIRSRSEEHTSELQSQSNLVCRLLLEKKKKKQRRISELQHRRDTLP